MAVSASSTVLNCTTPAPLDRPFSKRTSASCTVPVVWNSSTRSSFEVDQGSCSSGRVGGEEEWKQETGGQLGARHPSPPRPQEDQPAKRADSHSSRKSAY